jgi:hypothetical protein
VEDKLQAEKHGEHTTRRREKKKRSGGVPGNQRKRHLRFLQRQKEEHFPWNRNFLFNEIVKQGTDGELQSLCILVPRLAQDPTVVSSSVEFVIVNTEERAWKSLLRRTPSQMKKNLPDILI